jgi:type I restriction enzyme R subunit
VNTKPSPNFAFLAHHDPRLVALGTHAERYFADDPNTTLMKLRQFGELLAQRAAARLGLYASPDESQLDLLNRLRDRGAVDVTTRQLFHDLRRAGNDAVHAVKGDHREALLQLKMARELAIWFQRSFGNDRKFDPGPFVPPPDPAKEDAALATELERLRAEVVAHKGDADATRRALEDEAKRRLTAEERAAKEADERAIWEALAQESEAKHAKDTEVFAKLAAELAADQARAVAAPPAVIQAAVEQAADAGAAIHLNEAATRRLIDKQLRDAGWEVDSEEPTHARGTRPQAGKNTAIAEWPTGTGPADYVLFLGLMAVGVVEAKRTRVDVAGAIEQAKRYSKGFQPLAEVEGAPWGKYNVPFLFSTNGRPFLRQLETKSGIWFLDARRAANHPRALEGWMTPEGLKAMLAQDIDKANEALKVEPTEYLGLRPYQLSAIRAAEAAIASGQQAILLAMATGTGKTKTCIGLAYRLIKTKRFRRVLFLVDRSSLAEQTENAFKDTRLENLQTFTDIFELKGVGTAKVDKDTKIHVATIQGMVQRVLYADDGEVPPVDAYDCVVVDECHRGYLLDKELGEEDLTFRSEADYISKYRRVLDHFDAVKIGLTATPALHTAEIFGDPVFIYPYREAVIDGFLVDHEPPLRIVTKLAEDGMTWKAGEEMVTFDPETQTVNTVRLPDEVELDIDSYNRRVVTENFNRVVCDRLATHIDPSLDGKTIIFCVTDHHADIVVRLLKEAFDRQYGSVDDDAVVKITGRADKPLQLLRRFRNERSPSVAVTVDLLTTGVDIPKVSNLVFLRRVKSRILYDQMLGRATRLCPEMGKEAFHVFDAVDLYTELSKYTDMKPVAVDPTVTFGKLSRDIQAAPASARLRVLEQFLAKFQRKRRRFSPEALAVLNDLAGTEDLATNLRANDNVGAWFASHPHVAEFLDKANTARGQRYIISGHEDELREEVRGYGKGERPKDYLDAFAMFVRTNLNKLPALVVVTQRPRELTRAQLKELKLILDKEGYSELALRTAWRETTNADIAASIIGFVRQSALGDALVPYDERVGNAMKGLLASKPWTQPQRQWLERIGKQLVVETIVDREALDDGEFKKQGGGFERINKQFDGKLDAILGDLREAIWESVG